MKQLGTIAAVIVIILLAGGAVFYLNNSGVGGGAATTTTNTSTSMSTPTGQGGQPGNSTSVEDPNGLQLRFSMNATTLQPGEALQLFVSEYNTKSAMNNVSTASNWPVQELSLGSCGHLVYPFGFAIFEGYYTSSNVSQGQPLGVFPNVPCPLMIRLITGYLFEPMNDSAAILPGSADVTPMVANATVTGSFSSAYLHGSPQPFSPGEYTVVAGDEWGGLAVLHFSVTTPMLTSVSTSSVNSTATKA